MKEENKKKSFFIEALEGFPVGVTLLVIAYISVFFIAGEAVFNTELNQLHNINTLITQIMISGLSGYILFIIFGIIDIVQDKNMEKRLIYENPWRIVLALIFEIILVILIAVLLGNKKIFGDNISNINILIFVMICTLVGLIKCIKSFSEEYIIREINKKIKERNN